MIPNPFSFSSSPTSVFSLLKTVRRFLNFFSSAGTTSNARLASARRWTFQHRRTERRGMTSGRRSTDGGEATGGRSWTTHAWISAGDGARLAGASGACWKEGAIPEDE